MKVAPRACGPDGAAGGSRREAGGQAEPRVGTWPCQSPAHGALGAT